MASIRVRHERMICFFPMMRDGFFIMYSFLVLGKAIPHKDCATDASSNFSSDETKSGVNTWYIHEHFCEIWESVSYLTYADCVVRFFERWREKRRKSFVDFRVFSRNISENMHARCVREDTKQALKENLQADGVQSRQTLFVRYCPMDKMILQSEICCDHSCFCICQPL